MDTLFTSSRILINNDGEQKNIVSGGILVSNEDGTIKKIITSQSEINSWFFVNTSCDAYNFGDHVIMPGIIDLNVNSCSGRDDLEDFDSLTKAAACGGISTIVDNPT